MQDSQESAEKHHYVCQTYVESKGGLQLGKQFQYTSESQAQERAEREFRAEDCIGADAYMIIEDQGSEEISAPMFIVRLGNVPEFDGS